MTRPKFEAWGEDGLSYYTEELENYCDSLETALIKAYTFIVGEEAANNLPRLFDTKEDWLN